MRLTQLYLALCFIGVAAPLSQFIPWVMEHGFNIGLLITELFSTRIGAFFGLDVIVSAVVLIVFILHDSKKSAISNGWLAILATLSIGVSLGLPLYLYMRERNNPTNK